MYPVPIFCRICSQLILAHADLSELLTFNDDSRIIIYLHKGCKLSASQELLSKIMKDLEYDIFLADDEQPYHEC